MKKNKEEIDDVSDQVVIMEKEIGELKSNIKLAEGKILNIYEEELKKKEPNFLNVKQTDVILKSVLGSEDFVEKKEMEVACLISNVYKRGGMVNGHEKPIGGEEDPCSQKSGIKDDGDDT